MSMDRCDACGRIIDTDFDLECYVEMPNGCSKCVCEICRDECIHEDELNEETGIYRCTRCGREADEDEAIDIEAEAELQADMDAWYHGARSR